MLSSFINSEMNPSVNPISNAVCYYTFYSLWRRTNGNQQLPASALSKNAAQSEVLLANHGWVSIRFCFADIKISHLSYLNMRAYI